MNTSPSIEFARLPRGGQSRVNKLSSAKFRSWCLALITLLLLFGSTPIRAQSTQSLVATLERVDPAPPGDVPSPGYVTYSLKVTNTSLNDPANHVVVTDWFGPDALYDVTVNCTAHGTATCPAAGNIQIQDGRDAGRVRIVVSSLPLGGGLTGNKSYLDFRIRGVVRGYPNPLGAISSRVQATDSDGDQSTQVQIQDGLSTNSNGIVSKVTKTLDTAPSGGGLPWDSDIEYTLRFKNAGTQPMPLPNFADMHQYRNGQPSESYTSSGVISNDSTVLSCNVTGSRPADAPPLDPLDACPYAAGDAWTSTTTLRPVLPKRDWNAVLYPGQAVVIKVREVIHSPDCLVPNSGNVDASGRLNLTNRAFFNYNSSGPISIYRGDSGGNTAAVLLPMRPLPDCRVANLKFDLQAHPNGPSPADLGWGQSASWTLSVKNVSDLDFGNVPVDLQSTLKSLGGSSTGAGVKWNIVSCTPTGGATCPWTAPPHGNIYMGGAGKNKNVFKTSGATIPKGGELDIVVEVTAVNPGDACGVLKLQNNIWRVSVDNPPAQKIHDGDGNEYDTWDIVGNTGGSNNSIIGNGADPTLTARGNAKVNYTSLDPDCQSGNLKKADPYVSQLVAQAPIIGGNVVYDVTVYNTGTSPDIAKVSLLDELAHSGIDLSPGGISEFTVTCEQATSGATCPGGVAPTSGVICQGSACPLGTNSELSLLVGTLPQNSRVTIRFSGKYKGTATSGGGEYYNEATIEAGDDADYQDTNLGNNYTLLTSGAPQEAGKIRLKKVLDDSDGYNAGDTFEFGVTCGTVELPHATLADGETQDVIVPADTSCTVKELTFPTPKPGYVWDTPVYSPSQTVSVPSDSLRTVEIMNSTSPIDVDLQKTVGDVTEVSPGVRQVTYTIVATNPTATATTYSLTDNFQPDPDTTLANGYPKVSYVAGGDGLDTTLDTFPKIVTDEGIAGGGVDTYKVVVRYRAKDPDDPDNNTCTGAPGHGLFNRARLTTIAGKVKTSQACADNPHAALPTITKKLIGQDGTNDAFAEPGEKLTYRITVGNAGTTTLQNVAVVDTIPANTTFVSADNGGTVAAGKVNWSVDVPAGGTTELTVVFKVDDAVPVGVDHIANNATANGETCATTPCVTTPFAEPKLSIQKTLTAESGDQGNVAEPGETLTYTIKVTNSGDVGAKNVSVVDVVPDHVTASVPAGSDGVVDADGNVKWTVDVGANTSITRKVKLIVANSLPAGVDSIDNNATVNGQPCATTPCVSTPVPGAAVTVSKQLTSESGDLAGIAEPGETLTYTLTLQNNSGIDAKDVKVVDVTPEHTTLVTPVAGGGVKNADGNAQWTVDVDDGKSVNLTVAFKVDDTLPADAKAIVNNATANGEACATTPCVSTPTSDAKLTISKQLTAENGTQANTAEPGERLTYTITVTNSSGVDAKDAKVVDITPPHTTLVTPIGNGGVQNADGNAQWMVDVAAHKSVTRTVSFTVDDKLPAGVKQIANNATVNGEPCAATPCVATPVAEPVLSISKQLTGEDGTQPNTAEPGEKLIYTITITNESGVAAADANVVDTVPANTSFVTASNGGTLAGGKVHWTVANVPANATVQRTATFKVDDTVPAGVSEIVNNATVNNEPCAKLPCVSTPMAEPKLAISKALTAESGKLPGLVEPGEQLTYTITVTNPGGVSASDAKVVDTLPPGTTFVSADHDGKMDGGHAAWTVDVPAGKSVALQLIVRMSDAIPAGLHAVVNNATVNDTPCADLPCVQTPVVSPPVAVDDSSKNHVAGTVATVPVLGNDKQGSAALDPSSVWIEGARAAGDSLTVAGEGEWSVNTATGAISFTPANGYTGDPKSISYSIADVVGMRSNEATIKLDYNQNAVLRLTKKASVKTVMIGDLVRYTLTIENVGTVDVSNAVLRDTPPHGFTLVPKSLRVVDADGTGTLESGNPLRVSHVDVAKGETATVTYILAVGTGVLPGAHTNKAVMLSSGGASTRSKGPSPAAVGGGAEISNEASATVTSASDPLFEQSLIVGTVFDDRDGDGWQDPAVAKDITVYGLGTGSYIPGSTTVDRGNGPESQSDASLDEGLDLGRLAGRDTIAQAADTHRIVVSQRVRQPSFRGSFKLVTNEGTTVSLDSTGTMHVEKAGDAAKGLTAEDIQVRRVVQPDDGAYRVDYVITNSGVQEQGIPGVRLATVDGLLVETDAYGRYHLAGIPGGDFARGFNFILKVDKATLPPGSKFTTENPLIRRLTPGMPARFDFGVQIPEQVIAGGKSTDEMTLGEVFFRPDSAEIRPQYQPRIEAMAKVLDARGGGEVKLVGTGGNPGLAYDRAKAVAHALHSTLDGRVADDTRITIRTKVDGPEVLSLSNRIVIGEVFFDTDSTAIKPEYAAVISKIAATIETGGPSRLLITGHTDQRGSDAYNLDLGKRRAEAVYAAIADKLSVEARKRLHVDYLPPTEPVPSAGRADDQKEAK